MQTKVGSLTEAITNTAIGYLITITFLPIINKICGIHMSIGQATLSTLLFTILSVARGYIIRRAFEGNIAKYLYKKLFNKKESNYHTFKGNSEDDNGYYIGHTTDN